MKTLYFEYYKPMFGGVLCEERHQELLKAIHQNLAHPSVDRVVVFTSEVVKFSQYPEVEILVVPSERITFQEIFDYANTITGPDDIHILCNTDVGLVSGFDALDSFMGPEDFYCLSRYELDGTISDHAYGSQDTWIWRGKNRIKNVDFHLGIRGCDCHLIGAARRAHYQVTNPSKQLITLHFHASNLRNTDYHQHTVRNPWFGVEPTELGEAGEVCRFIGAGVWPTVQTRSSQTRSQLRRKCAQIWGVRAA
jgi:hypothetical protein